MKPETQYRVRLFLMLPRAKKIWLSFRQVGEAFGVHITPRYDLCMLAVQGPKAIEKIIGVKTRLGSNSARSEAFSKVQI